MITSILPVLAGAVMTAIVGNFLVQRWQMRNWREQQRQLGYKSELDDLRLLIEEISTKCADRHNAMRSLVGSLAPNSYQDFEESLDLYKSQITIWMASLNSFYVRLKISLCYEYTLRLEREVHENFVRAGKEMEFIIRKRRAGAAISWSDLSEAKRQLNKLQAESYTFLKDISLKYSDLRSNILDGEKIYYTNALFYKYSTFDLIKALFAFPVDKFYIIRSP